ncbi:hypothetical protein CK203_022394 [Vitis vinifera]|uniref:Uncharacterized protein n=1 Tax=Vitis vinifera TaxID=29760 RepID=A0A438I9H9_VITVI|nr:hypothetical protein CK203_022394 [Vitis vinifera]
MVDGFGWKPVLRADQCGSAKEGAFSSLYSLYVCITAFSSHLIGYVIRLILFILSTAHLHHFFHPSGDPPQFTTWRIVMSFPLSILRTHPRVQGSWDFLYMLYFTHEGMDFDHRVFELSFPSFLSPYHPSLHYVPCLKTILRPWDQISSSTASMWTALHRDELSVVRRSRLVESLLAISSSLRFAAACHTGAYFPLIVSLQSGVQSHRSFTAYDIQSHHVTFFSSAFKATSPVVGVQSHHHFLVSAFRAITASQLRRSESLSLLSLTFRVIIIASQFRRSEPSLLLFSFDVQSRVLDFGVQSRYHFSASAFRAIIVAFQFAVQSHHCRFSVSAFRPSSVFISTFRVAFSISAIRVVITFQFRHSEPSLSLFSSRSEPSSVFRSTFRVTSSVSAFRVVITSQFDVQSHHHHFSVSAFRAIIGFQIDIQSHILGFSVQSCYHFSV